MMPILRIYWVLSTPDGKQSLWRAGRYSDTEDRLDIMARMLEWRHIVPTSPDTLTSYPFKMDDPFLLKATPHVLFAGNQPAFGQRLVTGALQCVAGV
jgi:DNA polymerase delta subunit 2